MESEKRGGKKMKNTIEKGDKVNVHFNNGTSLFNCEVLYLPCAIGDSWHIKDEHGKIVYIQTFETMRLRDKK